MRRLRGTNHEGIGGGLRRDASCASHLSPSCCEALLHWEGLLCRLLHGEPLRCHARLGLEPLLLCYPVGRGCRVGRRSAKGGVATSGGHHAKTAILNGELLVAEASGARGGCLSEACASSGWHTETCRLGGRSKGVDLTGHGPAL